MSDDAVPTGFNGEPHRNGRAANGRFTGGNDFARGNPLNVKAQQLRRVLLETVSVADLKTVCKKLITLAKKGDLIAIRELMDRLFGRAKTAVELTGADGEPLGVSMTAIQAAIIEALADHPEARVKVAAKLRSLATDE